MILANSFWFEIATGVRPLTDIPMEVRVTVLGFINGTVLNAPATAQSLFDAVPLLGEDDRGLALAQTIIDARGTGFANLQQLWDVPGIGGPRFIEICRSIANTDAVTIPVLGSPFQPSIPLFSASRTQIVFRYELLIPGPMQGLKGGFQLQPADVAAGYGNRNCQDASSCAISAPSFNEEIGQWESQVQITGLILDGEDELTKMSIRMDHRMLPYDWVRPLDPEAQQFQFPAMMQLNNSMVIDTLIKETGQRMTLVSRDVPCQTGRVTQWPPYQMTLHTQDEVTYYDQADPLGPEILKILDGVTFLHGPENFFSARTDITSYEFMPGLGDRGLPAIVLHWTPQLGGTPMAIHHYEVHRTSNPTHGEGSWVNVSGPVIGGTWIDPNPPIGPLYYRVAPVFVDIFGEDYVGFPGQVKRVEPKKSVFRF